METILVQETDEATLEVLTAALQMEGFKVCSPASHNENIMETIRRHRPKLLLLECRLGNYSGRQVTHWIRSHFPLLPVIALSTDNQIDQEYHQYGFNDYLKKPYDLDVLYQVVRKYLPKRRKRREFGEPA